jgi:hypothetical protein
MVEAFREFRRGRVVVQAAPHLKELADRDVVAIWNAGNIFRHRIVETQFSFLGQQHDYGGRHCLGVRDDSKMRVAARRGCAAKLRHAVAEDEIALRRAQQNHGARQQKLLGCRFHGALKRDWVERLSAVGDAP